MKKLNKIGIFSASLLATVSAVYLFAPIIGSYADSSQQADVNLDVAPGIGIRVSSANVALNATVGSFVHDSVNVDVATNSQYGYTLTLEDKDDSSNMTATGISDVVSSNFSGKKTSSQMADNTWGFSLDATDYYMIPVNGSPVSLKRTNTVMTTDYETTTVDFGAKVGMNLTAGTYSDIVVFTAYVNGQEDENTCHDFFCITKMQEMTPEICASATTPSAASTFFDWDGSRAGNTNFTPRTNLIDTRDGNTYLVSKLADGNCWMSQSLALDLTDGTPIEISYNDGTVGTATPDHTTQVTLNSYYDAWPSEGNTWRSYHPKTTEAYYQSGYTKSSSPTRPLVDYNWEKSGNYYNWFAATAGAGISDVVVGETNSSICAKGWRLPPDEGTNSFDNLITTTYNIANSSAGSSKVRSAPLNFNLSGVYNYGDITNPVGLYNNSSTPMGSYWTSIDYEDDHERAYRFMFNKNYVWPHAMNSKAYGLTIRCVAI